MKKNENLDSKLKILTPNQEIFKNEEIFMFLSFFHFLFICFSFSLPVAPEIQESHEKQWKTMENHQKQRKMKKKWSCKWKKNENLDSKLQILTPNQEIFKNEEIIFFFHFFFHFPCPWHLKSRKAMKNNEKQWKTIKNKGKWKKKNEIANEKKWKFGLKVADSHSEPGNLQKRGKFHFFIIVLSFFFHFPCPWHLKSRKAMKINEKQWKTIKNKGKWKKHEVANEKKNENLDSKLQILTPNQEIFKNEEIFIFLSFFFHFFFHFPCPWHLKSRKAMKNNEKQWKTIKNKGKWKKMKLQMKKNENLESKLQILTPNQEIFKNEEIFMLSFFHFFSFSLPVAPEIQESHENQWKTMENHQKQRKMKKNDVANEKKMKIWTQSCRFSLRTRKSSKTRKFSFLSFFFIFLARGTWNPGKPWKSMKNNGKQSKTKENEKKMKLQMKKKWKFGLKVADSHSEPGNLQKRGNFHFFIIFSFFSSFFHFPCPWHLKSRKAMKNNGKPSKTKENEKKMKLQMKKKWKFGLKVADSHSEPGNLQKLEIFIFLSFFFIFFFLSFSLPVAPEIQESHEKQWKTMENHQKQRKMKKNEVANEKKMKIWTQSCRFSLRTRKSSKTRKFSFFIFLFFSFFFHFPCPWHLKSRKAMKNQWKTMENHQKQRKMKKKWSCKWKKNENLDSKLQILTPNQEIFKNEEIFIFFIIFLSFFYHFFIIFLARGTWNPGKPWKTMKNNGKPSKTKENEKKWSCKWKRNENLDSKLQILTPNQEIFKNEEIFIFLSFFQFFFIFLARGTWNPGKPWKTMKNNGKPSKTKENDKKMKLQMKKKWKFGLKVADSHSEPGNLQKLEENFIFLSFFIIFFSFSLPVAPEIQESHENQWKTMENHQKQRKMKKKWSCKWKKNENLDSKLQILTPNQEIFKNEEIFMLSFFSFSLPVAPEIQESHENQWKTMENHQKQRKMKKKWRCKWKKMKIWTQSCRFSLRTRKSSKTRKFSFFYHFFFIFLARGTWNPGKPWKTMKNNGKPSKTKENEKKNEVANEKKWKFGLKVADSHSEPGNLQKLEEIFIFLSFFSFFFIFFSFSLPVAPEIQESHEKQWKTMENHQKQRKMKKNEVANEKKMKIWTQSCRFSLRTRKSSKTRKFHFLSFFHFFSFFYHFPCPWHLKSRKAMKNNEKQFKNKFLLEKEMIWTQSFLTHFFHFFIIFFSFSLPVAPEIQESHEKQWKTMENHQKQRKMKKNEVANEKKMKIWTQSCRFSLRTRKSSKTRGNFHFFIIFFIFFHFLSFFFHFPCPWHLKSRKAMKINEKQWKTIKNKGKWKKNEVANEKKMKIWTQSCRFSLRTRKSSKTRKFSFFYHFFHFFFIFLSFFYHLFFIFLARGTWNPGKPWKTMKNNGKPSKTKENEKKWSCKWKKMKIWTQSCRFSLRTRKSSKTRGNFHFFFIIFFIFFHFFHHFPCPWHLKSRKAMKNNEKQWKTIKNKGKWKKMKLH